MRGHTPGVHGRHYYARRRRPGEQNAGRHLRHREQAGGGTIIGSEAVSRAAPDGTTLLINAVAMYIGPQLRKMSFDPLTNLMPICGLIQSAALRRQQGFALPHVGDFVAAARAQPERRRSPTRGLLARRIYLSRTLNGPQIFRLTYVPYPGNIPTVNAVLGGHVTAGAANYADWVGHLQAGTALRAPATLTPTRIQALPDLSRPPVRQATKNSST